MSSDQTVLVNEDEEMLKVSLVFYSGAGQMLDVIILQ